MPDGLILTVTGLVCVVVFVAMLVRADRRSGGIATPGAGGWLVLALGVACIAGGVLLFARPLFSG